MDRDPQAPVAPVSGGQGFPGGAFWLLDVNNLTLVNGQMTLNGTILGGTGRAVVGANDQPATFGGTASQFPAQINLTITASSQPGSFTFSPDPAANAQRPLATLAGTYTSAALANSAVEAMTIQVDSNGTFASTSSGPSLTGTLVPAQANLNAFNATLRAPEGTLTGAAFFLPAPDGGAGAGSRLVMVGRSGINFFWAIYTRNGS